MVKLRREFAMLKLIDSKIDPEEFITDLEEIRGKLAEMGREVTEEDLMIHIFNNLPPEYDLQVKQSEGRIGAATDPLTMEILRESLSLKYERLQDINKDNNNESDDKAFIGRDSNFKGRCHNCGKFGHKATACWEGRNGNIQNSQSDAQNGQGYWGGHFDNRNNNGNRGGNTNNFNINCRYCGRWGHKKANCFSRFRGYLENKHFAFKKFCLP